MTFERAWAEVYPKILGYLRRLARNMDDADDILVETAIVAWRNWHKVNPSQPSAWFMRIARWQYAEWVERDRKQKAVHASEQFWFSIIDDAPGPDDVLAGKVRLAAVLGAMSESDQAQFAHRTSWTALHQHRKWLKKRCAEALLC